MKDLLGTKLGKALFAGLLLIVVLLGVIYAMGLQSRLVFVVPVLWALILTALLLVGIDLGFRAWQRRRQAAFDARMAAKEGIEDRRREWAEWTTELKRQGIDRYQLPMYLLVGEPQSGKSVLLRNSDLHFPFGQTRLSGVGGTRGCDWWFTDQAVILDLAGRLFTHEGGASDEAEWSAFLELLYEFRPQCPANGVLLVLPCDGLAAENEPEIVRKAARMQAALTTLTGKLQARLPVYVVLTKADKVFGFAECVHRLDAPRRHEMFGWSRPLEKLEVPFDLDEAQRGFEGMVERARLLRSQMLATARIPEALTEVDRLYAFPEEFAALWPTLAEYLRRIFTESRLLDQLFFRGLYLTSGLQSGAPIAKVCAELMGSTGEADRRHLEGLFTKQRAYFIKDLIRERVFTEQGLVRPTQQRVLSARRNAIAAYGIAGVLAVGSMVWTAVELFQGASDSRQREADKVLELAQQSDLTRDRGAQIRLLEVIPTAEKAGLPAEPMAKLREGLFSSGFVPDLVAAYLRTPPPRGSEDFAKQVRLADILLAEEATSTEVADLMKLLPSAKGGWFPEGMSFKLGGEVKEALSTRATELWDGRLDAGSGWAPIGHLGFVLAMRALFGEGDRLRPDSGCPGSPRYGNAVHLLLKSAEEILGKDGKIDGLAPRVGKAGDELEEIVKGRQAFDPSSWELATAVARQLEGASTPGEARTFLSKHFKDAALVAVCDPRFLALDPEQLPRDLGMKPEPGLVEDVFRAKRDCAEQAYREFKSLTLLEEWTGSDARAFDPKLSNHLGRMLDVVRPGAWHDQLTKLLDSYEEELLKEWDLDRTRLGEELRPHLEQLGDPCLEWMSPEHRDRVVTLLLRELDSNVPDAARQLGDKVGNLSSITGYAKTLSDAAGEVSRSGGGNAAERSRRLAAARQRKRPPGGTSAFAELWYLAFCERVFTSEIRGSFVDRFQEETRALVKELWRGDGDGKEALSYLERGNGFDRLQRDFALRFARAEDTKESEDQAGWWSVDEFAGSSRADPEWRALAFLQELQACLLAGDPDKKRVADARIKVTADCDEKSATWGDTYYLCLEGGGTSDGKRQWIDDLQEPANVLWDFSRGTDFSMRWTKKEPGTDNANVEDDLRVVSRGRFAPLLLAWNADEDDGRFRLETVAKKPGQERAAIVTFSFDPPVPPRPAEPFTTP